MRTQPSNRSLLAVCLVGCLVIGVVGVGVVAADDAYDLTVTDAVEVPSQTIDDPDLNEEHEIDAFAVRQPGEPLDVSATVPDDEGYYVDIYNSDRQWERGVSIDGSETVTFDGSATNALEPGSYSLVLDEIGGPFRALHPVVISGYEITISHSDEIERDGTLGVEIEVTPTALEDEPTDVELVLWNEDTGPITEPATGSDGTYSASIDLDGLDLDEYNLHATALGDDEYQGKQEPLGLSDQGMVEVVESGDDGTPVLGGDVPNGAEGEPGSEQSDNESEQPFEGDGDGNETDATSTTVELIDEAPDSPGVTVSFENRSLRTLTFENESAIGNVTLTDRSDSLDTPPNGTTLLAVEITVPTAERDAPATLEFDVAADAVNDSAALSVERYVSANETWSRLETNAVETNATIAVTAETPGFSLFAVTETVDESATPSNSSDVETETDSTPIMPTENETEEPLSPEDQSGFGGLSVAGALIAVCCILLRRVMINN